MWLRVLFYISIFYFFLPVLCESQNKSGIIRIDLIRHKSAFEQHLNAPNLDKYGFNFDWFYKKHHNTTNDSIALYRYLDNEFYGKIVIGHPGQSFNVAFDTAWYISWVVSSMCPLTTIGCLFHNKYDHTKSSEWKEDGRPFISYNGKYNLTGFYSYDNISIAHSNAPNQSFVEITSVPYSYLFNKIDGVLGLGLKHNDYTPFFYTLLKQNKIKDPVFSIYLNRDKQSKHGGNVMLGFIDKKHIHSRKDENKNKIYDTIKYLDVKSAQFWQFDVDSLKVLLKEYWGTIWYYVQAALTNLGVVMFQASVDTSCFFFALESSLGDHVFRIEMFSKEAPIVFCQNGCSAISDTSSNNIYGPKKDIDKLHIEIKAKPFFLGRYQVECDTINKLPNITFTLGGQDFTLKGRDYTVKMSYFSVTICLSAFVPQNDYVNFWALGGAFLSEVYTIYNIQDKQIGFVKAA